MQAQFRQDSLLFYPAEDAPVKFTSAFDKQNNSYNFLSDLAWTQSIGLFKSFLFDNFSHSSIRAANQDSRETHKLKLGTRYLMSGGFSLGYIADVLNYKDSHSTAINSTNRGSVELFSQYSLNDSMYIALSGGYIKNRQIDVTDKGTLMEFESNIKRFKFSDISLTTTLKFREELITPRQNQDNILSLLIETADALPIKNELKVIAERQRNDFYLTADSISAREFGVTKNIQQRIENNYGFEDRLANVNFAPNMNGGLFVSYLNKEVNSNYYYVPVQDFSKDVVPTRIIESRLEIGSDIDFISSQIDSRFKINFQERDERRSIPSREHIGEFMFDSLSSVQEKNNSTSKKISLAWTNTFRISDNDDIGIIASHSKLQYDTPSGQNFDDRDELLSIARVSYQRVFFPFFRAGLMLEGSLNHIVYISSLKSSNNFQNKILRLQTLSKIDFTNFSNTSSFEILANYTVYDYKDPSQNLKSFSFRQFIANDSLTLVLTSNYRVSGIGYIKISEQASMNWIKFTISPLRENRENFFHLQFITNYNISSFGIGIRYFSLTTFSYRQKIKEESYSYTSIGPSSELILIVRDFLDLRFSGWYEFITRKEDTPLKQSTFRSQITIKF